MKATVSRFWFAALLFLSGTCGGGAPAPAPGERCPPNPDHAETVCYDSANLLFCALAPDGTYRWSDFAHCKMGTCSCDGGGNGKEPWYPNARGNCNCWY